MAKQNTLFIGLLVCIAGFIGLLVSSDINIGEWTTSTNSTTIQDPSSYQLKPLAPTNPQIRHYTFEITEGITFINGTKRSQTLINGKFPGPPIHAVIGDEIVVEFINNSNKPSSLHMHGLSMRGTNFMDGFTGLTQCAVKPGHSFTYNFIAQDVGTYYYHGHFQADTILGLYGPILIQDTTTPITHDEEIIILLSDIYSKSPDSLLEDYFEPYLGGIEPVPELTLLQGKTDYVLGVTTGKKYRFHIINASSYLDYRFSIDNHLLNVVEIDGFRVRPRIVNEIPIASAQRYSFYIVLDMTSIQSTSPGYWIRAKVDTNGMPSLPHESKGVLTYDRIRFGGFKSPQSVSSTLGEEFGEFDLQFLPETNRTIPTAADVTLVLNATMTQDEYGIMIPGFNGKQNQLNHQQPLLAQYMDGHHHHHSSPNIETLELNQVVDLVLYNQDDSPHPFHLHGHKFWVIERGNQEGTLSAKTPIMRDTVWVNQGDYVRIRFISDNPGVWGFHCHNVWHSVGGMEYTFVVSPSDLRQVKPPHQWFSLCLKDELPIIKII